VTWRSLPKKDQLFVLTMARLSEPLTQSSLQTYMFYQLKSFDELLSDSTISSQAGMLQGAFTAAQFLTAIAWGRVADSSWGGRKMVLLVGLFGTAISAVGFGFSRNFATAIFFRALGGALNGNLGVMRTMISETVKEKKYQSRAFLLLPMTFNIGVIIGPVLGGLLADPVGSYPSIFGPNTFFGGKDGVAWMMKWPYALPNLLNACFLSLASLSVLLFLEETLDILKDKPDYGLRLGGWLIRIVLRGQTFYRYSMITTGELSNTTHTAPANDDIELQDTSITPKKLVPPKPKPKPKLPFRQIWTRNVLSTFLAHGLLAMHIGTFNSLWFVYLSAARFDPTHPFPPSHTQKLPLHFTGGLALTPARIGAALAILGVIGISLQLLFYPWASTRFGTLATYRTVLWLFPLTYTLTPFLSLIPSTTSPPSPSAGFRIWLGIAAVLAIQVTARTFALPGTTILVNNCCPHPSVLGTVHGVGQSVSSATRTIGPVVGGWVFGYGLRVGVVGVAWWGLAALAVLGAVAGWFVREGTGREVWLEGEEE
ncbi:MFS general substrate transporter, partial [Patellaria atrata CBS 101060]